LIDVYPINRLIFVCLRAPKAPKTIDPVATNKKKGCQNNKKTFEPNKKNKVLTKNEKTLSLTKVAKKNVTGVKTPSYTSGVQAWQGKIESLNQKPKKININPKDNNKGKLVVVLNKNRNSAKSKVLVIIKIKAIPNSNNPDERAPKQKYFIPASIAFWDL
jgi:hypothetical protein